MSQQIFYSRVSRELMQIDLWLRTKWEGRLDFPPRQANLGNKICNKFVCIWGTKNTVQAARKSPYIKACGIGGRNCLIGDRERVWEEACLKSGANQKMQHPKFWSTRNKTFFTSSQKERAKQWDSSITQYVITSSTLWWQIYYGPAPTKLTPKIKGSDGNCSTNLGCRQPFGDWSGVPYKTVKCLG